MSDAEALARALADPPTYFLPRATVLLQRECKRLGRREAELLHVIGLKDALIGGLTARVAHQAELLSRVAEWVKDNAVPE